MICDRLFVDRFFVLFIHYNWILRYVNLTVRDVINV
jgi:hypothetical protein